MKYDFNKPWNHPDNLKYYENWKMGYPESTPSDLIIAFIWDHSPFGKQFMEGGVRGDKRS